MCLFALLIQLNTTSSAHYSPAPLPFIPSAEKPNFLRRHPNRLLHGVRETPALLTPRSTTGCCGHLSHPSTSNLSLLNPPLHYQARFKSILALSSVLWTLNPLYTELEPLDQLKPQSRRPPQLTVHALLSLPTSTSTLFLGRRDVLEDSDSAHNSLESRSDLAKTIGAYMNCTPTQNSLP